MKKYSSAFFLLSVSILIAFFSCKKINEATEVGGDLVPAVDNIHTFEATLDAKTNNRLFNDTTTLGFFDDVALGHLNDPEFGVTDANAYFDIARPSYGVYPFQVKKDSVKTIDSVVLSLSYTGGYGDTSNTPITVRVFELAPSGSGFDDTTIYKFAGTKNFNLAGGQLGSKTFLPKSLNDSVPVIRPGDTTKVTRVLRIPLSTTLGLRFRNYDTCCAYKNDSNFKASFRGFAVKADATGNSLAYFSIADQSKTKLIIYYKGQINGKDSTLSTEFIHIPFVPNVAITHNPANFINGQANEIIRNYSGNALTYLNSGPGDDDKLYIQSGPGTYATIKIPGLDTFKNKVIHRAEIIATRISPSTDVLTAPTRLMLDRINKTSDTAFMFQNDLVANLDGSIGYAAFGGTLQSDNAYHFNITRYVQSLVTKRLPNDTLRLYAPFRTTLFNTSLGTVASPKGIFISVPNLSHIAQGRVVLAGGNYTANPASRLRLRIIYSDL